jgi:hypothetical protein
LIGDSSLSGRFSLSLVELLVKAKNLPVCRIESRLMLGAVQVGNLILGLKEKEE